MKTGREFNDFFDTTFSCNREPFIGDSELFARISRCRCSTIHSTMVFGGQKHRFGVSLKTIYQKRLFYTCSGTTTFGQYRLRQGAGVTQCASTYVRVLRQTSWSNTPCSFPVCKVKMHVVSSLPSVAANTLLSFLLPGKFFLLPSIPTYSLSCSFICLSSQLKFIFFIIANDTYIY